MDFVVLQTEKVFCVFYVGGWETLLELAFIAELESVDWQIVGFLDKKALPCMSIGLTNTCLSSLREIFHTVRGAK